MLFAETIEAKFTFPSTPEDWLGLGSMLASNNPALVVLLALMIVDVVTGVFASWVSGEISSAASYKGMVKKGVMLALVATARIMEFVIPNAPLMTLGCMGFSCTELWSIIENAGRAGVPLPAGLKLAFEKFREKEAVSTKSPVVEVIVDGSPAKSKTDRPSDVVINMSRDSGELDIVDNSTKSRIIVPKPLQGEQGETGPQGERGFKGDKGDKG